MCITLEASNKLISAIEINGLKRTEEKTIHEVINIKIGDDADSFNKDELQQSLTQLGLFSKIDITTKDTEQGLKININLREKITKLIIPLAKSGSNETAIGLLYLDSNFLGRGDTFVAVAIYGKNTNLYSIFLNNKHFFGTNFTSSVALSYDSTTFNNQRVLDTTTPNKDNEFSQNTAKGSYAFGYNFGMFTTLLSASYKSFKISNAKNTVSNGNTSSIAPILMVDKITYEDFLSHGFDLKSSVSRNITNLSSNDIESKIYSTAFELETGYSFKIAQNSKIALGFDMLSSDLPFVEQKRTFYGRSMRSLVDKNISYQNFIGGTLSHEYLFYSNSTFGFSHMIFAEGGKINGKFDKNYVNYTGAGTGLNIYFKKVAIPALGLYITNNFKTNITQVIFVMGMSI
jgi:hypothetical protein